MRSIISAGLLLLSGCSAQAGPGPSTSEARDYLEEAIEALQEGHVNRERLDWAATEAEAFRMSDGARTPAETYPAIRHVIAKLGEKHTVFEPPAPPRGTAVPPTPKAPRPQPEARLVDGRYGYLRVTQVVGSREDGTGYAATLRNGIRSLDARGACGWIVDVRANSGGNVWPMIDGVGALLGEPPFLIFDVPGQGRFEVLFKEGVAYQKGGLRPYTVDNYAPLRNPQAPVAILIDGGSASSAEALVVAFGGRPHVRRFGERTADYITVNNPVRLSDGAQIYMTVGWNMDRTGKRYEKAIEPDERVAAKGTAPLVAATRWLATQSPCQLSTTNRKPTK